MKAVLIKAEGEWETIETQGTYEEICEAVGGYIEYSRLKNIGSMYVNEEGKLLNLPVNMIATTVFSQINNWVDVIVGDAIVFGPIDENGNETPVTQEFIDLLVQVS